MRRLSLASAALAALAALASGCAPDAALLAPETGGDPGPTVEVPPLSPLAPLMLGVPRNGSIPSARNLDATFPARFDLAAVQSPVKHQGQRGTCSIFSTVGLMEHLYIKAGQPGHDFSEQYLQWSTKFQLGAFTRTPGSNAYQNVWAIHDYGIPEESAWPYEAVQWNETNDPACVGEEDTQPTRCFTNGAPPESALAAPRFSLPYGHFINTADIKQHLTSKGTDVVVAMEIFYQAWNHGASKIPVNLQDRWDGIVRYPNPLDIEKSREHAAGHSILIVGWDDDLEFQARDTEGQLVVDAEGRPVMEKGFYIFKNSWGTASFGYYNTYGRGYGYLSMRYVHEYGSAFVIDPPPAAPAPASP
jgi:C1A family cysteine protease